MQLKLAVTTFYIYKKKIAKKNQQNSSKIILQLLAGLQFDICFVIYVLKTRVGFEIVEITRL